MSGMATMVAAATIRYSFSTSSAIWRFARSSLIVRSWVAHREGSALSKTPKGVMLTSETSAIWQMSDNVVMLDQLWLLSACSTYAHFECQGKWPAQPLERPSTPD